MNIAGIAVGIAVGAAVGALGYYIANYFLDELNVGGGMWTIVLFLIPASLALVTMAVIAKMFT